MSFTVWDVLIILVVMLAMVAPGYILRKLKLIGGDSISVLAVVTLYCAQPFLTMKSFVLSDVSPDRNIVINMLIMFGMAFFAHLLGFVITRLFFLKDKDRKRAGAYTMCSLFSNAGFIGIPFVALLTKNSEAVIYATVFMVVFNALIWTMGVFIITGDIKAMRPRNAILNPSVIVLFIALPMFFFPEINIFKMNETVGKFVTFFGDATLPLSMLIVGVRMADIPFKSLFTNKKLYLVSGLKLIFVPLLCLALLFPFYYFGVFKTTDPNNFLILVFVMLMAVPPAASTIAICERYHGDIDNTVKGFILATLVSLVTIPAVLLLLQYAIS